MSYGETINIDDPLFRRLTRRDVMAQAIVMRLSTERGTYWTDPAYGLAVIGYVNAGLTPEDIARIPAEVEAQLELDERVVNAAVEATITGPITARRIRLDIRIETDEDDTFELTLSVSELTVEVMTKGVQE